MFETREAAPWTEPVMLEFMFETTRAVTNLVLSGTLVRYHNLKLIVPHAGATLPVLADRIAIMTGMFPALAEVSAADILPTLAAIL